jgi:hypothetical protein
MIKKSATTRREEPTRSRKVGQIPKTDPLTAIRRCRAGPAPRGHAWQPRAIRCPAHISVGDVVGHDLHAAAVMGQVRIALRAYALDGRSPADVVTRLDRFMTEAEIEFATTVVVL